MLPNSSASLSLPTPSVEPSGDRVSSGRKRESTETFDPFERSLRQMSRWPPPPAAGPLPTFLGVNRHKPCVTLASPDHYGFDEDGRQMSAKNLQELLDQSGNTVELL